MDARPFEKRGIPAPLSPLAPIRSPTVSRDPTQKVDGYQLPDREPRSTRLSRPSPHSRLGARSRSETRAGGKGRRFSHSFCRHSKSRSLLTRVLAQPLFLPPPKSTLGNQVPAPRVTMNRVHRKTLLTRSTQGLGGIALATLLQPRSRAVPSSPETEATPLHAKYQKRPLTKPNGGTLPTRFVRSQAGSQHSFQQGPPTLGAWRATAQRITSGQKQAPMSSLAPNPLSNRFL